MPSREVRLLPVEVARVGGEKTLFILREQGGERRVVLPVSKLEAAQLDVLLREGPGTALFTDALAALGGKIDRVRLDEPASAQVFVANGASRTAVTAPLADALGVALRTGAPIVIDELTLRQMGISPDDLRSVRFREPPRAPAPVQTL